MQQFAICGFIFLNLIASFSFGQSSRSALRSSQPQSLFSRADYQPSPEKKFDLLHTKLDVRFDYAKRQMPGKAWLTLQPHFYTAKSLQLDAKGMFIHKVAMVKGTSMVPLSFDYSDSLQLDIVLNKEYRSNEKFTVYIEYTARPDDMKFKGSLAITDAKGLYFINPDGKDSSKPIQIWTQGETEATSVWCPIIDKTNQKTTTEISMTVPSKYVSLSNGALVKQTKNADGTRTDTWKMDVPHSPYLFFMGVGDFAVIKDRYKNLPVDYYVEKKYASVAKGIFGETPSMIGFFSQLLGVDYPWNKYAQMVGQDYVSGAMENTTATLHGAAAYQNARQLKDENKWEIVVAHELFHQWFGDLVTAESWSNLTVNESFADFSEYLWLEHKYGADRALDYNYEAMRMYLSNPTNSNKHLVRFQYNDKEDMFDAVSYQKGGRILNMLRYYIGDSAFFKGLRTYLVQNKFKNAEAHQLRLALEEVSGKDLNWFFDQWYFGTGHPKVEISYVQNEAAKKVQVVIEQLQPEKLFYLPLEVDVYTHGKSQRLTHWIGNQRTDTIDIVYATKPDWINVDPAKLMLWEKQNKQSETQWMAQAMLAKNALDKWEVLEYFGKNWKDTTAYDLPFAALLQDSYFGTRKAALNLLKRGEVPMNQRFLAQVEKLVATESDLPTKAIAIDVLGSMGNKQYSSLFVKGLEDSSYSVAGASLEALARTDAALAVASAPALKDDAKGRLTVAIRATEYLNKDTASVNEVLAEYKKLQLFEKLLETNGLLYFANKLTILGDFKKVVGSAAEASKMLRSDFQGLQTSIRSTLVWMIRQREQAIIKDPNNTIAREQLKYLKEKTGM